MSKHRITVEIPDNKLCDGWPFFDGGDDGFGAECKNPVLHVSEIGEGLTETITRSPQCIEMYGMKEEE